MPVVMIVDDESNLAEMAAELLAMAGHTVTTAISGQLGLESLDEVCPDVILLDVMMPIMSGIEMLRVLKQDAVHRAIPVVMMSAAGREVIGVEERTVIAGFLQKPFTYDALVSVLGVALGTRTFETT